MAIPITIRGTDKLLRQFNEQANPFWRILAQDKSVVFQNTNEANLKDSYEKLQGILENLSQTNIYYLQLYKTTDKKFTAPFANISFVLSEEGEPTMNGTGTKEKEDVYKGADRASFNRELELIKENAILRQEKAILEIRLTEQQEANRLLKDEIKDLEEELDEIDEEDEAAEEQEKAAVGNPLMAVAAELLKNHGPMMMENLMSKGVRGGPPVEEPLQDNVKVSGLESEALTLYQVVDELEARDDKLYTHLHKLLLIARQKPMTFKYFLSQLEKF